MQELSVAQAKEHFSEVLARVAFTGETYLIKRRGKPMAAIVNAKEILPKIEETKNPWNALWELGKQHPEFVKKLEQVVKERRKAKDRWENPLE